MEKKKTTTITSETHEVFIVRRRAEPSIRMWCADCAAEVEMLKPEEAAAIANVSTRTIYRWIEDAQIHHCESVGGNVVVCPKQLFR
ncbi:MAG: helix-turn-helix domain-containing protein [Pyrinomonadaceae bacterium]